MPKRSKVVIELLGKAKNVNVEVNSLRDNILSSLGNLGNVATGVLSTFNLAKGAVDLLAPAIGNASQAQLELTNTANQYSKLVSKSYSESVEDLRGLRLEMNDLANTLPGTNDDYLSIAESIVDNLVPAVEELDGSFTAEGMNKYAKDLAKNFGFIAATTEATGSQAGLALNRILTEGKSLAEVGTLDFFENNPALVASIEKTAAQMGVAFDEATVGQRVEIVSKATSISQEALDAAGEDISVLVSTAKAKLFGSQGIFSLTRLLGDSGDSRNVIGEISKTAKAILDPNGPFGAIFTELGNIGLDPMLALADGIKLFRDQFLPQIKTVVDRLVGAISAGGASGGVNAVLGMLENLDFANFGFMLGQMLGKITNALSGFIQEIDYASLRGFIVNLVNGVGVALISWAVSVDWMGLVNAAGFLILASISTVIQLIGSGIVDGFNLIKDWVIADITTSIQQIRAYIDGIIQGGTALITGIIEGVQTKVAELAGAFEGISSAVSGLVATANNVVGNIGGAIDGARNAASNISIPGFASGNIPKTGVGGVIGGLLNEASNMPSGASVAFANSSEVVLNRNQQRDLVAAMSSRGGGDVINIYVNENGDANNTVRQLEKYFNDRSQLA